MNRHGQFTRLLGPYHLPLWNTFRPRTVCTSLQTVFQIYRSWQKIIRKQMCHALKDAVECLRVSSRLGIIALVQHTIWRAPVIAAYPKARSRVHSKCTVERSTAHPLVRILPCTLPCISCERKASSASVASASAHSHKPPVTYSTLRLGRTLPA
jgi:hypothetical protein